MTPRRILRGVVDLVAAQFRSPAAPAPAAQEPSLPPPTLASRLVAAGATVEAWTRTRRGTPATYVDVSSSVVSRLRAEDPDRAAATIRAADAFVRHEFDLLGSGPFTPIDPDRPARHGYRPIDWYLDPVRRLRFPRGVPHREWKLYEMRPANADVKYPWELARCQHWATLGQAFVLSGNSGYAIEILRQLDDFVEANPTGIGINWTCTMDVALRAVSWTIALDLIRTCEEATHDAFARAHAALFDHGVFIRSNLENTYEVTSNHFLSNVVGLWFLGSVFHDLPEGREWLAFARASLEQEIDVQVLADGADFESALPYHRLVTELFLGCARLADTLGTPLSDHYRARVRDMAAYLAGTLRPDGLMPQIGDADDGRLHLLTDSGAWTPQDPRHVLGSAGAMFDNAEWAALAGRAGRWEAAWWGLSVEEAGCAGAAPPARAALFPDAGVAIARESAGHYLMITNARVGTRGFGNHKHNDQLSFEYHLGGVPLIVDPGSFVYTSDAPARNLFRGTAYHNTVSIDGIEQNEMNPEWLFRLFESANAQHVAFRASDATVEYTGRHTGYARLAQPVEHERRFVFDRRRGALTIVDRFAGEGRHEFTWHLHVAPGVGVTPVDGRTLVLAVGSMRARIECPPDLQTTVSPAWYSPSYGVRLPCQAIALRLNATIERSAAFTFTLRDAREPA